MDIKFIAKDYQFIYRVSAIIYNIDKTKILYIIAEMIETFIYYLAGK